MNLPSTNKIILLFIFLFSLYLPAFSQAKEEVKINKNKIGAGGCYFGKDVYIITASYSRILKGYNEVEFPVYYTGKESTNELIAGIAFNWATMKKGKRFNLFISPAINFNEYWYQDNNIDKTVSRHGYFICLGVIPSVKFSANFSMSFELRVGHGYQWGVNDEYVSNGTTYHSETGWYGLFLTGLKANYHF